MTLDETGMIDALMADYYFMSTNTMTIDGELVNIDGNGNIEKLCPKSLPKIFVNLVRE